MRTARTSLAIVALALASPSLAATDGTLGPASSGAFNVTANISAPQQDNVQVYGLNDVILSGTTGEIVPTGGFAFCIIRTVGGGDVGVTVSSIAANDTSFVVRSQSETLPLAMTLQRTGGFQYTQLTEGVESTFSMPPICDDEPGAEFAGNVSLLEVTVNGEPTVAGTFSNTFLITVAPK